ncbi:hypothetical protein PGT21_032631 [Puccinia graminis f. sp. tritici]|uniref:Uncharacterized protein n=1 Tax=Puccinia graminis f. sp. tritici TaxID=56615 RepID=A0A5B0PK15_PUCGR|nr:hypothetical protein PGT21_032631 [Puccinia graminis f. sp. tritici]KAA1120590.1 hypothetical protein PGTUg99_001077 [Puccinia graminis f. sp. tritici]
MALHSSTTTHPDKLNDKALAASRVRYSPDALPFVSRLETTLTAQVTQTAGWSSRDNPRASIHTPLHSTCRLVVARQPSGLNPYSPPFNVSITGPILEA